MRNRNKTLKCYLREDHFNPGTSNHFRKNAIYLLEIAMEFLEFIWFYFPQKTFFLLGGRGPDLNPPTLTQELKIYVVNLYSPTQSNMVSNIYMQLGFEIKNI